MKPRHAAALALAGWYLMAPPGELLQQSYTVDFSAPLSKWEIISSHDTAIECEQAKRQAVQQAPEALLQLSQSGAVKMSQALTRAFLGKAMAETCVATDDPRLKGN